MQETRTDARSTVSLYWQWISVLWSQTRNGRRRQCRHTDVVEVNVHERDLILLCINTLREYLETLGWPADFCQRNTSSCEPSTFFDKEVNRIEKLGQGVGEWENYGMVARIHCISQKNCYKSAPVWGANMLKKQYMLPGSTETSSGEMTRLYQRMLVTNTVQ